MLESSRFYGADRALPDADLDAFVDTMARRIASFDKQTIADIKRRVHANSLPSDEQFGAEWGAFLSSVQRPYAQRRVGALMGLGLGTNADPENHLDVYIGKLGASK